MQVVELRRPRTAPRPAGALEILGSKRASHADVASSTGAGPAGGRQANLAAGPDRTGRRGAGARPLVAILPWGDVFEDWLDRLGISPEIFAAEFTGSWMFGYVEALSRAGVDSVVVCVTGRVRAPRSTVHRPTGAELVFLPSAGAHRLVRGRRSRRHLAPYLATPPLRLARTLRARGVSALLCQEYETPRFDLAVVLGRLLGVPVFASFQGGDYQVSRLERLVRPLTIGRAERLLVATRAEAERLEGRYGLAAARLARVFNPVDVDVWRPGDRAAARAELGLAADAGVVAWHGQLQIHRKGLDVILDAFARLRAERPRRETGLLLVGAGEDGARLREAIAARGLEGVILLEGWLHGREGLARLLSAADVYAFASRHEGLALAPVEAMACGLPLVAADVSGVRDVLEHGEEDGGIVVAAEDAAALAAALGGLLDDEARRRALAGRARRRAVEAFGLDAVGAELRSILVDRGLREAG